MTICAEVRSGVQVEKRVVDPAFKLFGRSISLISPPQEAASASASTPQDGGCVEVSMGDGIDMKAIESANEVMRSLKKVGDMNNNDREAGESSNSAVSAEKNKGEEEEEEGDGEDGRKEEKHVRCPRCDSGETKFCYYNNYNVNQPRHFCKNCQRYWTAGGTLRNVPVGAGRRRSKNPSPYQRQVVAATTTLTAAGVLEGGGEGVCVRRDAPDPAHSPHISPFSSGSASVLSFRREIEPRINHIELGINKIEPRIHQFNLPLPLPPQTKTQSSTVLSFGCEISPPLISSLTPTTHNFLAPLPSHSETTDHNKHFGDDSASSSLCTQQPDIPLPPNPNYEERSRVVAKQVADIANYAKGAACLMGWNGLWRNYLPWNPATQAPIWYPSTSSHFLDTTNNNKPVLTSSILAKQYPPLTPTPTLLMPIKIESGHSLRIDDPVEAARSSLWPAFRSDQQN